MVIWLEQNLILGVLLIVFHQYFIGTNHSYVTHQENQKNIYFPQLTYCLNSPI